MVLLLILAFAIFSKVCLPDCSPAVAGRQVKGLLKLRIFHPNNPIKSNNYQL